MRAVPDTDGEPPRGPRGHLRLRADRLLRIHVGNARPFVVFSLLKRFLRHEGYDAVLAANITDINDKIYDAARARRAAVGRARGRDDRALPRATRSGSGLGRPDLEPRRRRWCQEIVALIEALVERGHAYEADGDVYFRVRSLAEYGALSHRRRRGHGPGRGARGRRAARRTRSTSRCGRGRKPMEDTAWDSPWGAAGRAGTSSARRWPSRARRAVRGPRRRQRPDLPPPRERGGPDARRPRARARADLDAQRDARRWATREDGRSRWATSRCSATCSTRRAATR